MALIRSFMYQYFLIVPALCLSCNSLDVFASLAHVILGFTVSVYQFPQCLPISTVLCSDNRYFTFLRAIFPLWNLSLNLQDELLLSAFQLPEAYPFFARTMRPSRSGSMSSHSQQRTTDTLPMLCGDTGQVCRWQKLDFSDMKCIEITGSAEVSI